MNYNKLLLDELRLVSYEKRDAALTDKLLTKAVTLNENLKALGYVLTPPDLAALAVSPSLDNFYANVAGMMDEVNAQPMYPGFPKQVMEMETAMFRFHQLVHYFSTYGMEQLFGVAIQKGWLPCERKNKSNLSEQILVLKAKTIRLIPDEECYIAPLRVISFRRERMTLPEREIVAEAISHVSPEQLNGLKVGFKENMDAVYEIVFALEDREAAFRMLLGLCQHTGDVLRCVDLLLRRKKYHYLGKAISRKAAGKLSRERLPGEPGSLREERRAEYPPAELSGLFNLFQIGRSHGCSQRPAGRQTPFLGECRQVYAHQQQQYGPGFHRAAAWHDAAHGRLADASRL